jgi:F-type H+-transporting ATPase subunit epsilon
VPVTLHVELVVPDREIWSGTARMVIAKTHDGDIGVLQSHPPVIGLLADGSVVRILDAQSTGSTEPGGNGSGPGASAADGSRGLTGEVIAAVSGGFLSVADDRVSILARQAELGHEVDTAAARAELEEAGGTPAGGEEPAGTRYARARLRAAGEQA